MKFNYQARTKEGRVQAGIVEAPSKNAALTLLQRGDLYITFLEDAGSEPFYTKRIKIFERVSNKDIVMFTRQLSIMFKSRVPLMETLETLAGQIRNPSFREKIFKLAEEVEGGTSLSKALVRYPKLFSPFFVSMVKLGEASGKLSDSLTYLADHLEKEYSLNLKIKASMVYPGFILFVFLAVGAAMVFYIIPPLAKVLTEGTGELPTITKITLAGAEFLKQQGWIIMLFILALIVAVLRYFATPKGKKVFDRTILKVPLINELLRKIYLTRFAENLSTLISGGLPIAQALEITADIVGNDVYKDIILDIRDEIRKGETISSVLRKYPKDISPLVTQMTMVGERTGRLDTSLINVVNFYEEEVTRTLDSLMSLLEPLLIIFLGLAVAGLVFSVFMPLYQHMGSF